MDPKHSLLKPLIEKACDYGKTSFELARLKALGKTADLASSLSAGALLVLSLAFFLLIFTIGISLWLGEWLGKSYQGFLVVACFYAMVSLTIMLIRPFIKRRVNDTVVRKMFN